MKRSVAAILLLAALCSGLCSDPVWAGTEAAREYALKAAFVYNFAQFTQWPADVFPATDSPFVIGVIGDDPFGGAMEQAVAGKSIAGHPMTVRHLSSAGEIDGCHLLFVPASQDAQLPDIFKELDSKPILTVGETDGFPWAGGIIRFLTEDNKVRFEIDPDAADKARLHISSKLMKLAKIFKR